VCTVGQLLRGQLTVPHTRHNRRHLDHLDRGAAFSSRNTITGASIASYFRGWLCIAAIGMQVACNTPSRARTIDPVTFTKQASKPCVPEYPSSSMAAGIQGLLVAEIEFDRRGRVLRSTMLATPDEKLARAAEVCLARWQLQPSGSEDRSEVRKGKVFFWFSLAAGVPHVFLVNDLKQRDALVAAGGRL